MEEGDAEEKGMGAASGGILTLQKRGCIIMEKNADDP